jgi:2-dehydropantoate 2-reductase
MRILVVGAGAIGGYFGGRLLDAGRDVTFLVRPRRAAQLAETGLVIKSPLGDLDLPRPPTISAESLREPFDLILLSCKAYDLDGAIESFAVAVGPNTVILPLLNGMRHLDVLDARFGADRSLGGLSVISAALDPAGRILHSAISPSLTFGPRGNVRSKQMEAIPAALTAPGFNAKLSGEILQEMWEKWTLIAAGAGITCLMRATAGDIVAAGAANLAASILGECVAIAETNGFKRSEAWRKLGETLTTSGSAFSASMLKDIERGGPIEADHIVGDLLRRNRGPEDGRSLIRIAYAHMRAYEARRARESTAGKAAAPASKQTSKTAPSTSKHE